MTLIDVIIVYWIKTFQLLTNCDAEHITCQKHILRLTLNYAVYQ
jgi:hypothetical protein